MYDIYIYRYIYIYIMHHSTKHPISSHTTGLSMNSTVSKLNRNLLSDPSEENREGVISGLRERKALRESERVGERWSSERA
jgi:hypothetical protein